jgi:hypothetical protein
MFVLLASFPAFFCFYSIEGVYCEEKKKDPSWADAYNTWGFLFFSSRLKTHSACIFFFFYALLIRARPRL